MGRCLGSFYIIAVIRQDYDILEKNLFGAYDFRECVNDHHGWEHGSRSAGQQGVAIFTHLVREMAPERSEALGTFGEQMGTTASSACMCTLRFH